MCIFCQIINNEIGCYKVYEDADVIAFLDISQTTKGHTLVLPKKHVKNLLECDEELATKVFKVTHLLAKKLVKNLNAEGCNILSNCNSVAGQTVDHMHIHLIPRYASDDSIEIKFHENQLNLDEILKQIKNC